MMHTVSTEKLRRLRNDVPVTAVIDQVGLPTRRRGARRTFQCPECEAFHTAVNHRTNLARCFACGRDYNPIDLVMVVWRWRFLDAVRFLSQFAEGGRAIQK